ncbi:MAG: Linoleoyl-CoA desaturase, partial [uncultured Friedmanniella sp.]
EEAGPARLRGAPAAVRPLGRDDADRERDGEPGPQPLDPLGHHVRPLPRRRRDLREDVDRRRDPRRVVPAPDARLGQHLRVQGHAHHDRQPVPPGGAPPVPGPAEQPVRRDRPQGARPLRPLRADLPHRVAAAAGRLGLAQGLPAVAAQRLAGRDDAGQRPGPGRQAVQDDHRWPEGPAGTAERRL